MKKKVVIFGASGHGKVVADIVRACGDKVIGFLDDDEKKETLGKVSDYNRFAKSEFIIGIGNPEIRERLSKLSVKWYTGIHPSAVVSKDVMIGEGTIVMPNSVINVGTVIGKHSIINSGAVVEHDNQIGDYVHMSVGAKTGGNTKINDKTWVGIGATICNNISICSNCIIGAGAVVVEDIKSPGTYIGVPAKRYNR